MKILISAICAILLGLVLLFAAPASGRTTKLLGGKQCSWGPSYWCSNITTAKNCRAVPHCIQTVWEKKTVPEDNDSICQICLDMVKQARDQLQSNETQNDLKAVFEGSCQLIPLKIVQKECIKLADDFIPELIEALASQMNPQVVCSVAGLCNNAAIDVMLEEAAKAAIEKKVSSIQTPPVKRNRKLLSCSGCNNIASVISEKFHSADRDDILDNMLHLCGRMSSFSDACGNIVLTYFNDIYAQLKGKLDADGICHISGVCSAKFHQHPEDDDEPESIEVRPMSDVGVVPVKDDIPCELCEQLVEHLRDLLIADTTEAEFKMVLQGLCNQTQGFKSECLSIVDQYYDVIYKTLVNDLDANGACFLIGVCPKGLNVHDLPIFPPARIAVTIKQKPKMKLLGEGEPQLTNEEIQAMQLPIDRLMGPMKGFDLVDNGQVCTLCEYFLHFVQETLATPATEAEIKNFINNDVCNLFPKSLQGECHNFVDMYGDAVIALIIQDIDAREICPILKMCPQDSSSVDMEVFAPQPIDVSIDKSEQDKPTCPLCLFAVEQAQSMIKSDKSKAHIKQVLDGLCSHLTPKLKDECVDFVETYSNELIQMLITDFTSQQICVYIKLCPDSQVELDAWHISVEKQPDVLTNEIEDNTVNGQPIDIYTKNQDSPQCLLCEKVIKEAEKMIVNKKSREQVKNSLEHVCQKLPKIKAKCQAYVDKYGDKIVDLIMMELTPKQVCRELGYCIFTEADDLQMVEDVKIDFIQVPADHHPMQKLSNVDSGDAPTCVLCEFVITKLEQELKDKTTQDEIKAALKSVCKTMPKTIEASCEKFVDEYEDMIINLINMVPPKEICQELKLCPALSKEVTDEVIECGVCHGAAVALTPFLKEQNKQEVDPQEMIEKACETLPAKYYQKCSKLIEYYGESIHNLIKYNTDQSKICASIGKCFKTEASNWSYVHIVHASEGLDRVRRFKDVLVGQEECTYGPSHWCSKREVAQKCDLVKYCEEKVWNKVK